MSVFRAFWKERVHNEHFIFSLILNLVILIILICILSGTYLFVFNHEKKAFLYELNSALDVTDIYLQDKFQHEFADLKILSQSEPIIEFLNGGTTTDTIGDIQKIFSEYALNNEGVTQVRILDEAGMEQIRVNKKDGTTEVVGDSLLQNKANRYYFVDAMSMTSKQMYISNFDLNIENDKIVIPYEPTIRFAIKLYDKEEREKGILIVNVDGIEYLKIISQYELSGNQYKDMGILDSDNFWSLSHLDENDLESIVVTIESSQKDEFKLLLDQILLSENDSQGTFSDSGSYYLYRQIQVFQSDAYLFEAKSVSWYLVGKIKMKELIWEYNVLLKFFQYISIGIILSIMILLDLALFSLKQKERNKLILMATSSIPDNSEYGIMISEVKGNIIYTNKLITLLYGWTEAELKLKNPYDILGVVYPEVEVSLLAKKSWQGNLWQKTKQGKLIKKAVNITSITNKRGKIQFYVFLVSNARSKFSGKEEYENNTYYILDEEDILTAEKMYLEKGKNKQPQMVIALQISGACRTVFEENLSMHAAFIEALERKLDYDKNIKIIAVPKTELLFMSCNFNEENLLIHHVKYLSLVTERLNLYFLQIEQEIFQMRLPITYYFGVSILVKNSTFKELLKHSLIALEALLKYKRSKYMVYDIGIEETLKEEQTIKKYLVKAFAQKEFGIVYQPQFGVYENEIVGMEVLVRWENPILGNIPPYKFVPILEEMDEIHQLAIYVFNKLRIELEELKNIKRPIRVSVNLSAQEFLNPNVFKILSDMNKEIFSDKFHICIEITETTLIENLDKAREIIFSYTKEGFEIAIDDFGTGYSSLGYLYNLNATELKIDRIFIKDYPQEDDGKLLSAIARMGNELNIRLILEGIETSEQLRFAKSIGIKYYQGYYGAKPIKLELLKRFFELNGLL